jgi:predicted MFS family arabinose efflux permease
VATVGVLPNTPVLFYGVFALMGAAGIAASAMPYAVAIAGWFDQKRGLALGLMVSGSGVGAMLAPQLARSLTDRYGWRIGFIVVAGIATLVPLLVLLLLVRDPPRARRAPGSSPVRLQLEHFSYVRDKRFWYISLPILGVSVSTIGIMASLLVPLLSDRHSSSRDIAAVISVAGLGSWVGRIAVGYTMDRIFAPFVAASVLLLTLCGVAVIAYSETTLPDMFGAALVGLALGSEADVIAFLVSRYFPYSVYSSVLGAVWIMWAWGGGIGTYLAGKTFDLTGSYHASLGLFALILLLSIAIVLRLGSYRYPARVHGGDGSPVERPELGGT